MLRRLVNYSGLVVLFRVGCAAHSNVKHQPLRINSFDHNGVSIAVARPSL
jgi:hypothetical protein